MKIVGLVLLVLVGGGLLWATCLGARVGCGVAERTLDPDNVIFNYEWFHDVHKQVMAHQQNIEMHKKFLSSEEDKKEKRKLRIELVGMQQICRSLVQKYNANSLKLNRRLFKEKNLPSLIEMSEMCQ